MTELLDRHHGAGALPGAVALVADGDDVEVSVVGARAFGGAPMTRDSIFRIASVSKPITAATVLTLVDDGTLTLDAPVATWLPELASPMVVRTPEAPVDDVVQARRPITVRDLLEFPARLPFRRRRSGLDRRRPAGLPAHAPVGRSGGRRSAPAQRRVGRADDQRPPDGRAARREPPLPGRPGWGYGGSVDVDRIDPWNVPGRYGWVGGSGTAAHIIPATTGITILLTRRR